MKGVPVNPSALTSVKQAFIAFETGFRDALNRRPMNLRKYTSVLLVKSYRRGYEKGLKK